MRNDKTFRTWVSDRLRAGRENENAQVSGQISFDVLANACKLVESALLEAALTPS